MAVKTEVVLISVFVIRFFKLKKKVITINQNIKISSF